MSDELILEEFLPYRLAVLSNTVSTTVARAYDKRFNVSIPEWRVIAILGRFPGLSAVEVAERTMMDKVAVSRAVTKLVKNGRIDREFADADKRRSILNLSEEGQQLREDELALPDRQGPDDGDDRGPRSDRGPGGRRHPDLPEGPGPGYQAPSSTGAGQARTPRHRLIWAASWHSTSEHVAAASPSATPCRSSHPRMK